MGTIVLLRNTRFRIAPGWPTAGPRARFWSSRNWTGLRVAFLSALGRGCRIPGPRPPRRLPLPPAHHGRRREEALAISQRTKTALQPANAGGIARASPLLTNVHMARAAEKSIAFQSRAGLAGHDRAPQRAGRTSRSERDGQRSYLHGHSALSRASSRHSGGKGGHGRTTLTPDTVLPVYSGDRLRGSRLQTRGPAGPGDQKAVSTPWSRGRVD
jgi:hypothetical protein